MTIIDKSKELNTIRNKYGERFWANEKALAEAREVWGYPNSNEHGVTTYNKETLVHIGHCKGELKLLETNKGHWLMGLLVMSAFNGQSYAPSVWDSIGYNNYDSARKEGINRLISFFQAVAGGTSSCNSKANKENARKAIDILRSELTPQLSLF